MLLMLEGEGVIKISPKLLNLAQRKFLVGKF